MTDTEVSGLPESIRGHVLLTRLRSSLVSEAPDPAQLTAADVDPVASALALSDMQSPSDDVTG
jgi:hypothetical protein